MADRVRVDHQECRARLRVRRAGQRPDAGGLPGAGLSAGQGRLSLDGSDGDVAVELRDGGRSE